MKFLLTLFFIGSLHAQVLRITDPAASGGGIGNGGDSVICGNDVYMLDYVETFGLDRSHEDSGSVEDISMKIINSLENRDSYLRQEVERVAKRFLKGNLEYETNGTELTSTIEFTSSKLSNLRDEGVYKIPEGCKVEQLIIRRKKHTFSPTEFLVRRTLWDNMSNFQKAVGVVHEGLYAYMKNAGQSNSYLARNYNSLILSGEMIAMSDKEYLELREGFSLDRSTFIYRGIDTDNMSIRKSSKWTKSRKRMCVFDENDNIKILRSYSANYGLRIASIDLAPFNHLEIKEKAELYQVNFSKDGRIEKLIVDYKDISNFNNNVIKVSQDNSYELFKYSNYTTTNYGNRRMDRFVQVEKKALAKENEKTYLLSGVIEVDRDGYSILESTELERKKAINLRSKSIVLTDKNKKMHKKLKFNKNHTIVDITEDRDLSFIRREFF